MNTPAYPTTPDNGVNSGEPGMTLRDHFAGLALPALLEQVPTLTKKDLGDKTIEEAVAIAAYHYADAMLEARK